MNSVKENLMANVYYQLNKSIALEYEWNRGSRPSGYAQLSLRLQPTTSSNEIVQVVSDRIWNIRPTDAAKKETSSDLERLVSNLWRWLLGG